MNNNDVRLNRRFVEADDKDEQEVCRLVFNAYYPIVFEIIDSRFRNHPDPAVDADDIVSEAFTRAFNKRKGIQEPEKLLEWLITVAKNFMIGKTRSFKIQSRRLSIESAGGIPDLEDQAAFGSTLAETDAAYKESQRYQVDQLRHLLQGKDREVFEFRLDGLTLKKIAETMGLKPKTVEKRWERLCEWLVPIDGNLEALVECLPDKTDRHIMERLLDDQPPSEIAKAIGISSSAVAERVKRVIAAWKKAARANPEDPVFEMASWEG